ncbi:Clp protease N-terminal domain-containing protein [Nonomuraea jiangxiensis]|uniref:ATP-dependent Clp protease ATP-binding subunit ClpB n=1 Tax=Nonomuraea jiangxiensis TaxID=633440 RepID=A0A1G9C747_9ACTN|nr:Clp protease N-terminal domain-containing protein [Nonomuraea jiangxiensis]SDK47461.1 ATP-dependent Clp protease ATP-binding subunit ClpB [Nonomuraea jiangxiensis]
MTQKTQEALHDAQTKALRHGHTEVDGEHLLLALLELPEGLIPRLLEQTGADPEGRGRAGRLDDRRRRRQRGAERHLLPAARALTPGLTA